MYVRVLLCCKLIQNVTIECNLNMTAYIVDIYKVAYVTISLSYLSIFTYKRNICMHSSNFASTMYIPPGCLTIISAVILLGTEAEDLRRQSMITGRHVHFSMLVHAS